ncbi:MAG: alpha/beta hydrolase family protein [Gemmataceae bacterium]|nr:alpha/beta hydrolase family protein [Gemmataceae bacterium]
MTRTISVCLLAIGCSASVAEGDKPPAKVEKGTVKFRVLGDPKAVPERYRLEAHTFDYELDAKYELPNANLDVYRVRFPSPVVTECVPNNTVHAEYYRPRGKGPFPAVVVLDITAGDQALSRGIATHLAQNQIAALFVQMAYYGPRRPAGSDLRLLSTDVRQTMAAIRQTVLDIRRASAWLEARPEIDGKHIGILGTSLGSFMGALTAEMEPRFSRVAVLLGGGGLVDAFYDDPRGGDVRRLWEALGGTKASLAKAIAPVDPITCAANLKDRKVLMICAKRDEIVPPKAGEALWEACGKQKIVWYDCTHYGAALYMVPALGHVVKHFRVE